LTNNSNGVIVYTLKQRSDEMGKFFLGVAVTLAVLYPAVTKYYFGAAVDTTHTVVTNVMEKQ
jgi:hypothetical protein